MREAEVFGLLLLGAAWGAQIFRRSLLVRGLRRGAWAVAILGVAGIAVYWTWIQYLLWRSDGLGKFFLPPHRGIGYFILYTFSRLWGPWLIALAAGFLCGAIVSKLNLRFGERFFEPEEPKLFALGVFLAGYPSFLFYIALMLVVGAANSALYAATGRGRASLYYLWLPTAVFVIIVKSWFVPASLLNAFAL